MGIAWDDYQRQHGRPVKVGTIQTDARGLQYFNLSDGTKQFFMPPGRVGASQLELLQEQRADPNYHKGSLFKGESKWDAASGMYKQGINWNNLALMGAGGLIAAPAIAAALPAGAAPGAVAPGTTAVQGPAGTISTWAAGGGAKAATSSIGSIIAGQAIPQGISAVTNYFGNRAANSANERAAATQAAATKYAADLEAKAAEEALTWLKEQHAQREAGLTPYRQLGTNSLRQLSTPIPGVGTILGRG